MRTSRGTSAFFFGSTGQETHRRTGESDGWPSTNSPSCMMRLPAAVRRPWPWYRPDAQLPCTEVKPKYHVPVAVHFSLHICDGATDFSRNTLPCSNDRFSVCNRQSHLIGFATGVAHAAVTVWLSRQPFAVIPAVRIYTRSPQQDHIDACRLADSAAGQKIISHLDCGFPIISGRLKNYRARTKALAWSSEVLHALVTISAQQHAVTLELVHGKAAFVAVT